MKKSEGVLDKHARVLGSGGSRKHFWSENVKYERIEYFWVLISFLTLKMVVNEKEVFVIRGGAKIIKTTIGD